MLAVPLDYRRPGGRTIKIAVSRVKHTSSAADYQGVMLANPGGPGGSGLFLAAFGQFMPNNSGISYDWIGFDPRGVGASRPSLSCKPYYNHGDRPPYVPTTDRILHRWLVRAQSYADACRDSAPRLLDHMKTTDSARDMNRIRRALGVKKI
ncbi:MAG: alpha/beta fold hydrolase, partial [Propionibacteriales bacterium]|nr:alpha/beta fold hydrolase [Propionibacteriales bacterium]